MARTLRRLALWAVGTGLAVLVSWFGVQRALPLETAAGIPQTVPVGPLISPSATSSAAAPTVGASAVASSGAATGTPATSEPAAGEPGTGAETGAGTAGATAAGGPTGSAGGQATRAPAAAPATSNGAAVRSYQLTGGRVVLEMTETSARLVSATPEPDWRVQAWEADGWLRVDFSRDGAATSSCFVTWNGHPPTVQTT